MKSAGASVNVIVVNYNGRNYLDECLQSLRNQQFEDFSVTVVDNGSGDGSLELLSREYPEVRTIELDDNVGFARANNIGIKRTSGKYVALLNNDTKAKPPWLGELVEAMEREEENVGFAASKLVLQGEGGKLDTAGDFYSIAGVGGKIGHGEAAGRPKYNERKEVFGACAGAAIYRRNMLEEVGCFDEDFFITQEDVDLSYRARLKGYHGVYVPSAEVEHSVHGSIGKYSDTYVYYGQRNLEFVYLKNTPLPLLLATLLPHLVDALLSLLFYLFLGSGGTFLRAKKDALTSFNQVLQSRRRIQESRTASTMEVFKVLRKDWPLYRLKSLAKKVRGAWFG